MKRTADTIFLVNDSGELEVVPRHLCDSEDVLQELIEKYPQLLAADQIGGETPIRWLLVSREVGVPDGLDRSERWSVDHVLLDQDAVPTFVEVKRSTDTRIRREVVGQMLEYAANGEKYWPANRVQALAVEQYGGAEALDRKIADLIGLSAEEGSGEAIEAYWNQVEANLRQGQLRLLFVADELPRELRRIIEFLNEKMADVEVLGVELRQYAGSKIQALVPRVIGQTEATRDAKSRKRGPIRPLTREELLSMCSEEVGSFFETAMNEAAHRKLHISFGQESFTIRAPDENGVLQSWFYGYPPQGDHPACVEGYLQCLRGDPLFEETRNRYLALTGFSQAGGLTFRLWLEGDTIGSAQKALEVVWDVARYIHERKGANEVE